MKTIITILLSILITLCVVDLFIDIPYVYGDVSGIICGIYLLAIVQIKSSDGTIISEDKLRTHKFEIIVEFDEPIGFCDAQSIVSNAICDYMYKQNKEQKNG